MKQLIQKGNATRILHRTTVPTSGLYSFPNGVAGTVTEIRILGNSGTGDARFQVRINGANVFSTPNRPVLTAGSASVKKTGLSVTIAEGDTIALDLISATGNGLLPNPTFVVVIDDGVFTLADPLSPSDGDTLVYDAGTDTWGPGAGGGGGGGGGGLTYTTILEDDFADGTIDTAKWYGPGIPGSTTESGGKLQLISSSSGTLTTLNAVRGVDTQATVELISPISNDSQVASGMMIGSDLGGFTGYYVTMQVYNGNLAMLVSPSLGSVNVTFNGTAHRWLRIRLRNAAITFYASPDGAVWTALTTLPLSTAAAETLSATLYAGLRMYNGSGSSKQAEFDNFKLERITD